jgi:hypothetical protein
MQFETLLRNLRNQNVLHIVKSKKFILQVVYQDIRMEAAKMNSNTFLNAILEWPLSIFKLLNQLSTFD